MSYDFFKLQNDPLGIMKPICRSQVIYHCDKCKITPADRQFMWFFGQKALCEKCYGELCEYNENNS